MESLRLKEEKEIAVAVDSLQKTLERFREAFKFVRDRRESLSSSLRKVTALRKETIQTLKSIVQKTDTVRKEIAKDKKELETLEKEERILGGRYKELLSGRMPPGAGGNASGLEEGTETGYDFSRKKERFLRSIKGAFDELDIKLDETKRKTSAIREAIADGRRRIDVYNRNRAILFKKLDIYKNEAFSREKELNHIFELEFSILQEYSSYADQLRRAIPIPVSAENTLTNLRSEMDMASKNGAWPFS